jgi:hypothetical protein
MEVMELCKRLLKVVLLPTMQLLIVLILGVKKKFPTIIVEGSGRASDAMAAYVKYRKDPKRYATAHYSCQLLTKM